MHVNLIRLDRSRYSRFLIDESSQLRFSSRTRNFQLRFWSQTRSYLARCFVSFYSSRRIFVNLLLTIFLRHWTMCQRSSSSSFQSLRRWRSQWTWAGSGQIGHSYNCSHIGRIVRKSSFSDHHHQSPNLCFGSWLTIQMLPSQSGQLQRLLHFSPDYNSSVFPWGLRFFSGRLRFAPSVNCSEFNIF